MFLFFVVVLMYTSAFLCFSCVVFLYLNMYYHYWKNINFLLCVKQNKKKKEKKEEKNLYLRLRAKRTLSLIRTALSVYQISSHS